MPHDPFNIDRSATSTVCRIDERSRATDVESTRAMVAAVDARDPYTRAHSVSVAAYAAAIGRRMGLSAAAVESLRKAALLHDVGKIGVTDFILHKPGPLSPEEWQEMRRHPDIGYEMLKEVTFLNGPADIVRAHHERFDGKGYPCGLQGEEIPLGARIFAVADTFDAMTSDRPYRRALPPEAAREEIMRNAGSQFDPAMVKAFLRVYEKWAEGKAPAKERRRAA